MISLKKIAWLFVLATTLGSCETCYRCIYESNSIQYIEDRCNSKRDIVEFVEAQEELGWECKEIEAVN